MAFIEAGTKFPAFTLPDQTGDKRKLADLTGPKGLVLYVYPKDDTPGCTVEAQAFRDYLDALKAKGFHVVGLSKDSAASHCKFIEKYALTFPLLTDEKGEFLEKIGSWGEKTLYGKTSMGIIRSTFVVSATGQVLKVYKNVRANGHAEKVVAELDTLLGG